MAGQKREDAPLPGHHELFGEDRFHCASGRWIEPEREATHRVRPKLTVVERDLNETIVPAVLRQSRFPSQRTIAVEADQVFKAVFLAGAPIKKNDPAIREVD
jgi:hypothetical protein